MNLFEEIKELDDKYHFKTYARNQILLVEGRGARVKDSEGREYIDLLAGIAVNSLGHCHPNVVGAIKEQAEKLIHCTNLYYIEPQARLAEILIKRSDMDRVFFGNSGTEAVEGAMKLVRKRASRDGRGGTIVTMKGSFHGRSLAAVTATGQMKYREGFDPLPGGFKLAPYNDLEALEGVLDDDVCAIMLEPVQGEGGIRVARPDYIKGIRDLCDDHGISLIFDEIQCGMGRTGSLFAYQDYGVVPDVITIAKALGGGFPIGALLATEELADAFGPGDHGTTFGGNPLGTAAAYATVKTIIDEKLDRRAGELGRRTMDDLGKRTADMNVVREIRGKGLMIGVDLTEEGKGVVRAMQDRNVLSNCTAKTVMRFVPPLNIPEEDLETGIEAFIDSLGEVFGDE